MANSYLSRTISSAGNRKTFTLSAWVKRSKLSYDFSYMITAGQYQTDQMGQFKFDANDNLNISGYASNGSKDFRVNTNRSFRDVNAWYHVMAAVDTTQATASNRVKLYVNGVQETSFSEATYPSQNYDTAFNSAVDSLVGLRKNTSTYFEGYMSHVAIVDGAALAPTVFGETDSTSGIWKFKSPSGVTWGTNGVHLKFENSGALGTDSSGNTNTYTVNGDLKQALDTPSNVYATMNPLDNYYAASTFTEGNNTVEHGQTPWTYNTSTLKIPEATKFYCEGKVIAMNQNTCGIAPEPTTGNGNSNTSLSWGGVSFRGYQGDVQKGGSTPSGTFATYTTNDIIQIACDTVNNKIYFGKNGTWLNSGDPTSGASGTGAISIDDDKDYFAFGDNTSGGRGKWSINFGNGFFGTTAITSAGSNGNGSLFEYDVPSGYYALNTKNINTYG